MTEVPELPYCAGGQFVSTALTLLVLQEIDQHRVPEGSYLFILKRTNLNLTLLTGCKLKIAFPDSFRDETPQLPALPFTLLLDGYDSHLFLRGLDVREGVQTYKNCRQR
jgi:hypothetical protein